MRKAVRYTVIFFALLTAGFWTAFQFDAVQKVAKERLSAVLQEEIGCEVSVGAFSGAIPFVVGAEGLVISHPKIGEIKADSITIIPSWFEIVFGRFSLLWCTVDGLDLRNFHVKIDDKPIEAPNCSLAIHSLHAKDIHIPRIYYDPIITSYGEQSQVECLFSLSGSIAWKPSKQELRLDTSLWPYIDDVTPVTLTLEATLAPEKSIFYAGVDAFKAPDGSPFLTLPCDRCSLELDLGLTGQELSGSWNISGLKREKKTNSLNPIVRFSAEGNLHAPNFSELRVAATEISAQKIEPLLSYATSKKERLNQELLLADSEEPQDASTLSRITSYKVPKSLEATLKKEEDRTHCMVTIAGTELMPSCSITCSMDKNFAGSFLLDTTALYAAKELPITTSFDFTLEELQKLHMSDIKIDLAGLLLGGNLLIDLYPFSIEGKIASDEKSAQKLAELFDATLESLSLVGECKKGQASLVVSVDKLIHPYLSCHHLEAAVESHDSITSRLAVQKLANTTVTIDSGQFQTDSDRYSINLEGKSKNGPFAASSRGTFTKKSITVESLKAAILGHDITNDAPFTLSRHTISPVTLLSEGKAIVTAEVSPQVITATVSDFPLEVFDPFLGDTTLYGSVSGRFEQSDSSLAATLATSSLALWNPKLLDAPPLSASCEITMQNDAFQADAEIEGLSLKRPTIFKLTKEKNRLFGTLQAEFDLSTLLSSYLDEDELVEGVVQLDATINGTAEKPVWIGSLSWHEGKFFVPVIGTTFGNIEMHGTLHDNQFVIESLHAKDENEGRFTATGWIKNLLSKKFHYELNGKSSNFATIALPEAEAKTTGSLVISGNLNETNFVADMEVEDATYYLTTSPSKELPKLDITYIGQDLPACKKAHQFGLDLSLKMNEGKVVGMGLESTWKGDAHVIGPHNNVDVQGKILLTKGSLEFAGKHFSLTQGSLDFAGNLLKQSTLQVVASNDMGQISTQVALQGPLEHPRIVIQSNPAMSQKEILSWLLFNKSSSDITPMQGIQLGQTLLKLKGGANNIDLIEEIKQKLSIDRIDFGKSSTARPTMQESIPNEVSVQVGKYISDGVIVTLSKDVTNEVNRVGVEANLSKHITAQANVGDDANAELSLEWKLRY